MDEQATERDDGMAAEDIEAVRAALLRAYPEAVPELVGGGTVGALLASLEEATAVYRRIAAAAREAAPAEAAAPAAPSVPAGAGAPLAPDAERLPSVEKIRRGLMAR